MNQNDRNSTYEALTESRYGLPWAFIKQVLGEPGRLDA